MSKTIRLHPRTINTEYHAKDLDAKKLEYKIAREVYRSIETAVKRGNSDFNRPLRFQFLDRKVNSETIIEFYETNSRVENWARLGFGGFDRNYKTKKITFNFAPDTTHFQRIIQSNSPVFYAIHFNGIAPKRSEQSEKYYDDEDKDTQSELKEKEIRRIEKDLRKRGVIL